MVGQTHEERRPKKLIVCCDGTWIDSGNGQLENTGSHFNPKWEVQEPSNVTRIGRALQCEDSDGHPQIVFYQAGVGTGPSLTQRVIGGGTGSGLTENVREAYCFLANNYSPGDLIYLTGFSRGAFTARSIAALLDGVGLLTKHAMKHFYWVFADFENAGNLRYEAQIKNDVHDFKMFLQKDMTEDYVKRRAAYLDAYREQLKSHKFTQEVDIKAIGVWDTVGALGAPTPVLFQRFGVPAFLNPMNWQHPYRFIDTSISNRVENAFQALALDERRSSFTPTVWERPKDCNTNLKQVWFPGTHSNVGGSYDDTGLADISLAWMMSELEKCGLRFFDDYLHEAWLDNGKEYPAKATKKVHHHGPAELGADHDEPHWALTRLYNSATGITAWGGVSNRTPGTYHRVEYETGNATNHPLKDTQEFVHASVRIRLQAHGTAYDSLGVYSGQALTANGWEIELGEGEAWQWVKRGEEKVLQEDRLGRFEVMLLREDPDMAEWVLDKGPLRADSVIKVDDE
ncbi:hypothetical protein GTA08_BOTSDO11359 [Neofusicoccum parvum]|uniref:Uncharacterized protein n=1 Tax=Neofusicoccum parvum TaxID=310453 RepID=A0ACB5RXF9_9PEZI|nr:hypothetical protein GTA08_BOTSDO11359 [Neofusicoccum parvum]